MAAKEAPCAFCAIARGDAPAEVVVRTDEFVAFLDNRPLFHGHVLLAPTRHVVTFDELPLDLATEFVGLVQRIQIGVERAMGADGSLLIVNNVVSQSVPHLHQHVIPRRRKDGLRLWLGPRRPYASSAEMAETGARVRAAIDEGQASPASPPR